MDLDFLFDLPQSVFIKIAGFRSMYSGEIHPIPTEETEDQPTLRDGWTEEDATRLFALSALLSALEERERKIALKAVLIASPRYYHVLEREYAST